jgi:glutamyl-tRNA reductase
VAWARSRGATPVVRELREQFERLRAEEVLKSLRHFNEADYFHVERLTRAIINRLLHGPTARLKTIDAASEGGAMSLEAVRRLFALEGESNGERKESEHGR